LAKQIKKTKSKKASSAKKSFKFSFKDFKVIAVLVLIFILVILYNIVLSHNVRIKSDTYFVYIPSKASNKELAEFLKKEEVIGNGLSFQLLADFLDLLPKEKAGLFEVHKDWNNYQFISALQEDTLSPAKILTLPKVRIRSNMISEVASQFKIPKSKLLAALKDSAVLAHVNQTRESVYSLFIPGTYYVPDSLDEKELIEVMYGEFEHFFNEERYEKAREAGLTPEEVVILSSIVYSETKNPEEMPTIAGVYLNRLKKNMRLEADPTLVYASQNFNARRIYKKKKLIFPQYNTYARKGLPPGPIHFPPPDVIDMVLDFEDHEYIYFCAKDSTGEHRFAETYEEHKENANRYRDYLKSKKIF